MIERTPDDWGEYRRLVISQIDMLIDETKAIRESAERVQRELSIELAKLKVEARIWGFMGGMIASAVVGGLIQFLLIRLG